MAFDPYETWLGIPADLRPPTCYDLLGLAPHEPDPEAIEQAALRRMAKVRLHEIGPHSEESQAVLAELDRARLILMDPDRRAEYDAQLRARAEDRPGAPTAQETVEDGEEASRQPEPGNTMPDVLGSLVLSEEVGDGSHNLRSASRAGPSRWKKVAGIAAFLASHALLFGAFYFYVFGHFKSEQNDPSTVQEDPDTLVTSTPAPPAPAISRPALAEPEMPRAIGAQQAGSGDTAALAPADPAAETDSVKPGVAVKVGPETKPLPSQKKPDRTRMNSGSRGAPLQFSAPPIEVKPVFFVPRGEATPTPAQTKALTDHLAWCQERYREMLNGRDTFTLQRGEALVHRSRTSVAELKAAPEMGAPRITGELLDATRSNRFDCPYVFVAVVMNAGDNFPAGGGRPFNGGFNTGGGIVVVSSFALDKLPNFQSTLEHELGHAFGLPHIDVYGQSMQSSASIMSYNPAHHTRGMQPSPTPGTLEPEDVRGFSLNRRAFPKLAANRARDFPPGATRPRAVPLGPMTIDGQPAYTIEIATDSGKTFGTKVSNLIQNRISPSAGGDFDPNSMWQSGKSEGGVASVIVTFSFPVTLAAVGVHSEHSGTYNRADHVRVQAYKRDGFQTVADSPLRVTDAIVPLRDQSNAKIWRLTFHAANNKEVTLRGLQFFTRNGEIFPPPVPADDDVGFFR
jgi:hypothetical protein